MSLSAGHGWSRLGDEVAREGDEPVGVAVEEGLPVAAPLHPHLGRGRHLHDVHKMLRNFDPPPSPRNLPYYRDRLKGVAVC